MSNGEGVELRALLDDLKLMPSKSRRLAHGLGLGPARRLRKAPTSPRSTASAWNRVDVRDRDERCVREGDPGVKWVSNAMATEIATSTAMSRRAIGREARLFGLVDPDQVGPGEPSHTAGHAARHEGEIVADARVALRLHNACRMVPKRFQPRSGDRPRPGGEDLFVAADQPSPILQRLSHLCSLLSLIFVASAAFAADADNGRRLAQMRCVPCHAVDGAPRREIAEAPPFETIARKFALQPETLAFVMLDPDPRMNVALTRRKMEDIAAYINTLAK